jgi:hypothetical protein
MMDKCSACEAIAEVFCLSGQKFCSDHHHWGHMCCVPIEEVEDRVEYNPHCYHSISEPAEFYCSGGQYYYCKDHAHGGSCCTVRIGLHLEPKMIEQTVECPYCRRTDIPASWLDAHIEASHPTPYGSFSIPVSNNCPHCNRTDITEQNYDCHLLVAHPDKCPGDFIKRNAHLPSSLPEKKLILWDAPVSRREEPREKVKYVRIPGEE